MPNICASSWEEPQNQSNHIVAGARTGWWELTRAKARTRGSMVANLEVDSSNGERANISARPALGT